MIMFLNTLLLQWIFILLVSIRGTGANNISLNSSSSSSLIKTSSFTPISSSEFSNSSSLTSGVSTTQHPPVTSCAPVNFNSYFAPSLLALPSAEFTAVIESKFQKYIMEYGSLQRYLATQPSDLLAEGTFLTSEASLIISDAQSLFGTNGLGPLHLSYLNTNPCLFSACLTSYSSASSLFVKDEEPLLTSIPWYFQGFFDVAYMPSPPCCGDCVVSADAVEVKYWPTPAPLSAPSTLVDYLNNITYVSPSAYITLRNLQATNACGNIGGNYRTFRSAYLPEQLSSSVLPLSYQFIQPVGDWEAVNFADLDKPSVSNSINLCEANNVRQCTCTTNCKSDPVLHDFITDLCTPQLSLPPGVALLDPLWATCTLNLDGIYDPPFALTLQSGLTAPKTTSASPTPPSTPTPPPALSETAPGPGSTPPPPIATPTVTIASPLKSITSVVPPATQTSPVAPPAGITTTLPLAVVVNSQTITLNSQSTFTVGTQTFTVNSQGDIIVGTSTLSAGGPAVTIAGSTISIAPGGTAVVFGGTSTTSLGSIIASIFGSSTTIPAQYTGSGSGAPKTLSVSVVVCLVFGLSGVIMLL